MREQDWQKIKDLFALASEQPEERRAEFVREACGGDAVLRAEVESLLAAAEETGPLLESDGYSLASVFGASPARYEGREFGRYRIVRELGRGGMGAVFLAERADGEYQQRVALKLMRRSLADPGLARRFRQERQILASLNHPNVARLLDGGVSEEGEPYLVMEYVEGLRIDDYCDAKNLPTAGRLQLFLAVCRGVSYAHQNLVVHRDLKPSNILVTADGTPKLLDFGIAKLIGPDRAGGEQTRTELRAFTPEYASPEQVGGGPVTTASDVYSLGVVLRDLLGGARTPPAARRFPGGWLSASARRTAAANLPTGGEGAGGGTGAGRRAAVGAELANIVAMATREDPARRYASVAQLAEDVQRYLGGLPVRAQKDSFTYRAAKFVGRHKAGVGAALLAALSLVAGTGFSLRQAGVARRERDRAERRFTDVRQLANALLTDIAPRVERLQGSVEARRAVVVQSLKYLDSLAQEAGDDAGLRLELAAAYEKVGALQGNPAKPNLGDFAGAVSSYEKANRILRGLPATGGNQLLLAANLRGLANVRYVQNDVRGALRDYGEALKIHERLLAQEPGSGELRAEYLKTRYELAETYSYQNQYGVAVPMLRDIVAALEQFDPPRPETRQALARAYALLGNSLSWDDKQAEAEAEMAKATALADRLAAEHPNDTGVRHSVHKIYMVASSIHENIDDEVSLHFAHKALLLAERAASEDAANVQSRHNLARSFSRLGILYANLRRLPEALSQLERSEKVFHELAEREPANRGYQRDLGVLYTRFGDARQKRGDLRGALEAFRKSADRFEAASRADEKNLQDRRNLAQSLKSVGYVYLALGERGKAKENLQLSLEILGRLRSQNALGEWDAKLFEELRAALRPL